jgi:uncharacterized membrane protein
MKLSQKHVHLLFKIGVAFKGIDGLIETISGVALFFITTKSLRHAIDWLTQGELQEDPNDFVATHLVAFFHHFSTNTKYFAAIYLLIHGLVKVGLVIELWRGKLWAYPTALTVLGLFLCYQLYRVSHTHSIMLGILCVIDLLILILIWRDYKYLKAKQK